MIKCPYSVHIIGNQRRKTFTSSEMVVGHTGIVAGRAGRCGVGGIPAAAIVSTWPGKGLLFGAERTFIWGMVTILFQTRNQKLWVDNG